MSRPPSGPGASEHRSEQLGRDVGEVEHDRGPELDIGGQDAIGLARLKLGQGGLLAGRYDVERTQLYVTRGCGYWGPPVRLLAPLEITRVILRSA